jgi:prephenate dehydrogenase
MGKKLDEMTITIVGVGQIGGSLALAVKENQVVRKIIGMDKKEVIEKISEGKIFDSLTFDLESAIREADFIFLSAPVLTILRILPQIVPIMKAGAVLLDSGSTKREIVSLMKMYPKRILIGGHPMGGKEKPGFGSASSSLLKNKLFALVFPTEKSLEGKSAVLALLEKIGAIPFEIDEEKHDLVVSLTSHLPYVLSLSLSSLAEEFFSKDAMFKKFISSGFAGATRLSFTQREVGKGILGTNSSFIMRMIDEYTDRLSSIRSLIEKGNENEIDRFLGKIKMFQSELV